MIQLNDIDELAFEVEFMSCVIDKADNLKVTDSDSHFSKFAGVHPSKIKQGKLFLYDLIKPKDRETVMRKICKKDAPYVYFNFYIKNEAGEYVYVHATGQNDEGSTLCRLTLADVSRSVEKSEQLRARAKEMNHLIDLVTGGVCLFKVTQNMHIQALYLNNACCRLFGTDKNSYESRDYRFDDLIHPEDKSVVFQQIGHSMATKKPIEIEFRVLQHRDSYIWCKCNADIQRYDTDNCPIFHAMFTDITDIKNAEEEADEQSDAMIKMFKSLPGPIFCTGTKTPLVTDVVSTDFLRLLGYSRMEFFDTYGGDLENLITPREAAMVKALIKKQCEKKKEVKTTYSVRTKGGRFIVVEDKRKIIDVADGKKTTIGIFRDVTSKHLDEDIG